LESAHRLWNFDPKRREVTSILPEIATAAGVTSAGPVRSSLLAPFFFLARDKTKLDALTIGPTGDHLTLFANNYVAQGLKVKGCKSIVNRVYRYLSLLSPEELDECCFLGKRNGCYVLDVSILPEKYRLDEKRVEKMLNSALMKWLMTVEEAAFAVEGNLPLCS
jgi:hypothetical protein